MGLGYRWHPSGTKYTSDITVGLLMPYEHGVYRIIEVNPVSAVDWTDAERRRVESYKPEWQVKLSPRHVVIRPLSVTSEDVRARDHDRHMRWNGQALNVYRDEHYPICAHCLEPLPCRDQMAEQVATAASRQMSRYEVPGVCPACEEVITARQKSITWQENLEVLGGPPVTFHMRSDCWRSAVRYEERLAAQDKTFKTTLSCKGHVINHNDGTYQCTELTECPGPTASHVFNSVCRCPDCHARGPFGCFPKPGARNLAFDGDQS